MNRSTSEQSGIGAIKPVGPADWWVTYYFLGEPRRAGPYHRERAEHHLRVTHWRPDAKPRLKQMEKGITWSDSIAERKRRKSYGRAT